MDDQCLKIVLDHSVAFSSTDHGNFLAKLLLLLFLLLLNYQLLTCCFPCKQGSGQLPTFKYKDTIHK